MSRSCWMSWTTNLLSLSRNISRRMMLIYEESALHGGRDGRRMPMWWKGPRSKRCWATPTWIQRRDSLFFQNFLKDTGILEDLEKAGIQEGDTVRMYGLEFDYYK